MIRYVKATENDLEVLIRIRLEMLRDVNGLPDDHVYDEAFIQESRRYFETGDQTTVLAYAGNAAVGCASLAYIRVMPTFSHPTGRRAHLMNVYTRQDHRRQGIAKEMIGLLIREAREKGVTEISLDATPMGRPLYEAIGFEASGSCMVMMPGCEK